MNTLASAPCEACYSKNSENSGCDRSPLSELLFSNFTSTFTRRFYLWCKFQKCFGCFSRRVLDFMSFRPSWSQFTCSQTGECRSWACSMVSPFALIHHWFRRDGLYFRKALIIYFSDDSQHVCFILLILWVNLLWRCMSDLWPLRYGFQTRDFIDQTPSLFAPVDWRVLQSGSFFFFTFRSQETWRQTQRGEES